MKVLQSLNGERKGDGAAQLSTSDTPATIAPLPTACPKRRKSLFAHQIWSVERKPRFSRSSIYGFST